jgi:spore coat polysaccharide biosynthesis protein SpsF
MKIGVIIQARMGSTRLPGKVMLKIKDKTVLGHVIERVKQSNLINEIIVATTIIEHDNIIEVEALRFNVKVFRGSEEDVLSRYYYAAKEYNLDIIIRITSDCPLIDSKLIDEMIIEYLINEFDMLSNGGLNNELRTFPRGLDVAIFNFNVLEEAFLHAKESYQREHVSPYIYEQKKVFYFKNNLNLSHYRWTLDTKEDLEFVNKIYSELYKGEHDFYMKEILDLIDKKPEIKYLNYHIDQKKIK